MNCAHIPSRQDQVCILLVAIRTNKGCTNTHPPARLLHATLLTLPLSVHNTTQTNVIFSEWNEVPSPAIFHAHCQAASGFPESHLPPHSVAACPLATGYL